MKSSASENHSLCSVCDQPMLDGQALNGLAKTHWDCKPASAPSLSGLCEQLGIDPASIRKRSATKVEKPVSAKEELRLSWIENYINSSPVKSVNTLDGIFVMAYIEKFEARAAYPKLGAPRCPQLSADLGRMFRLGRLNRYTVGMPAGDASCGFPKWVYSYQLR